MPDKAELQAKFDKMIAANREEPGTFVLSELIEVRLPLIALELDELNAKLPALQAERQQAVEELAAAAKALEQTKMRFLTAGEADKTTWLAEIGCTAALEALIKERDDLQAAQRSIRRARG